ncbi:MAG TPA: flagellar biosynthetic protein FliR [Verrucomicrobiae bacterium]|jgi:flagellar biosynthetic protein FliR|nr:flagellar biosynthetic protein FliR [Verrucomicrobiae bacterium]
MQIDYINWMLIFLRVTPFLLVLPFFSAANFPPTMRIAIGALTALLIAPLIPPFALVNLPLFSMLGVMIQEITVGLLLGFVARMIFYAVDLAGNVISSEMGLNMAAMFNPLTSQSEQAPGLILFFLASVVMLTLDLHHWILLGFERTYMVLPIGQAHMTAALFEAIVQHTSLIFMIALQISAPVMAVSFVITLVFVMLSRAVPQMNVFAESFGFRVVGGLIVFGFTLQLTAQHVSNYLNRLPDDMLRIAQLMGGQ